MTRSPQAVVAFKAVIRRLRAGGEPGRGLDALPRTAVAAENIRTLSGPDEFRSTLLALVDGARERILISALYLQDDDAGREVLAALYVAKAARPSLSIAIFVDWHRAQRGLIGKGRSAGNAALYVEMARQFGPGVSIYGVPVQSSELMGVMHLKGFVIDDTVLYSGASLNDVYLHRHQRYRLDRYHVIAHAPLADSLASLMTDVLQRLPAVARLDLPSQPPALRRSAIGSSRRTLMTTRYSLPTVQAATGEVAVTPVLGLSARGNGLNRVILQLIHRAERELVLYTPYFNLPGPVRRALDALLRKGCRVRIVVGEKTANDFFIPPDEPFNAIGALPYLYESNLRRYCKTHQDAVASGLLDLYLWQNADHSFHLKGLLVDRDYALLTGSNLNPRAWRLDLENGLVLHDPHGYLLGQHHLELDRVLANCRRLTRHQDLDEVASYPQPVQRLVKRLARTRADRLVNQVL